MKLFKIISLMVLPGFMAIHSAFAASENNDMDQFARGALKWSNTCMHCHNIRDPKELDDADWRLVIMHMRIRAGLTRKDADDILAFMQKSNN